MHLTKTDYLNYLLCPRYAWLYKHRRDLHDEQQDSLLSRQGYDVEALARQLFPPGHESERSEWFMTGQKPKHEVVYQATAEVEGYMARADIMVWDEEKEGWRIYEVKSSTHEKDKHKEDLYFQALVFEMAGVPVVGYYLVIVNKDYCLDASKGIDPKGLFHVLDETEDVLSNKEVYRSDIERARELVCGEVEPEVRVLTKKIKDVSPQKLLEYYWKDVPEYSVYHIGNISKKKLTMLLDMGVMEMVDVPHDFPLSDSQWRQIELTREQGAYIDREALQGRIEGLTYPLYFLDYESINLAIPVFDGETAHNHVPFQYSLHIQKEPGGTVEHKEYLHSECTDPTGPLLEALSQAIGPQGTVVVWYAPFERGRNSYMAKKHPEYENFLLDLNGRIVDLMLFFKNDYVDYRFKGSTSIKNVLPVLVPELNYKELTIQHGAMAMEAWVDLIEHGQLSEEVIHGLKEYCKMDTWAMVSILDMVCSRLSL